MCLTLYIVHKYVPINDMRSKMTDHLTKKYTTNALSKISHIYYKLKKDNTFVSRISVIYDVTLLIN